MNEFRSVTEVEHTPLAGDECLRLLSTVSIGRLATSTHDVPDIHPVDVFVLDGAIHFRSGSGAKLKALVGNPQVALEVEEAAARPGWTVVAHGVVRTVRIPQEQAELAGRVGRPWWFASDTYWFQLRPTSLTGRRFEWSGLVADGGPHPSGAPEMPRDPRP